MARFFHPGERICKQWPAESRHCVHGAVITGEREKRVGKRQQKCYLVTLPEFGEGVTFHIVKKNFKVDVDPETFFESKVTALNPLSPPEVYAERTSHHNLVPNVFGGAGLREEIKQLWAEGIEVDDDNKPLPKDAAPAPVEEGVQYEYSVPTFCPRRASNNITYSPGRWV
jgi:hypothetical protein